MSSGSFSIRVLKLGGGTRQVSAGSLDRTFDRPPRIISRGVKGQAPLQVPLTIAGLVTLWKADRTRTCGGQFGAQSDRYARELTRSGRRCSECPASGAGGAVRPPSSPLLDHPLLHFLRGDRLVRRRVFFALLDNLLCSRLQPQSRNKLRGLSQAGSGSLLGHRRRPRPRLRRDGVPRAAVKKGSQSLHSDGSVAAADASSHFYGYSSHPGGGRSSRRKHSVLRGQALLSPKAASAMARRRPPTTVPPSSSDRQPPSHAALLRAPGRRHFSERPERSAEASLSCWGWRGRREDNTPPRCSIQVAAGTVRAFHQFQPFPQSEIRDTTTCAPMPNFREEKGFTRNRPDQLLSCPESRETHSRRHTLQSTAHAHT